MAAKQTLPVVKSEYKELIDKFIAKTRRRNLSELTLSSYRQFLYHFFYGFTKDFASLEYNDILTRIEEYERNKKPASVNQRLAILSGFFNFCYCKEYINKVPLKRWWRPIIPESIPRHLEKGELAKAKAEAEKLPLRDRCIFEFLESSGCRKSEIVSINIEDIDFDNRSATVIGKGQKTREIIFSEECLVLLQRYLGERINSQGPVFLNYRGRRLSGRQVYNITDGVGKAIKLKKHLGPHVLRHTWATVVYSKEGNIEFIRISFGHSDPNTTKIYIKIPTEQKRRYYERYVG